MANTRLSKATHDSRVHLLRWLSGELIFRDPRKPAGGIVTLGSGAKRRHDLSSEEPHLLQQQIRGFILK